MIKGLFETHLNVSDLERSVKFYRDVLELKIAYEQPERHVTFFWIGGHNQYMLGLWQTTPEEIQRQHFAFTISLDDMRGAKQYLLDKGLTPRNFLNNGTQDPMVFGWMPAVAIYFPDPDGHSLEFIAPLDDEARPDLGIVAWDEWEGLTAKETSTAGD